MHLRLFSFVRACLIMACGGVALMACATSEPQRIYRCGSAYTNQPDPAANCKPLTGSSVTVIEGTKVQGSQAAASSTPSSSQAAGVTKVDGELQRQRDAQAQTVLQVELQRAQKLYADLLREWNDGEPERRADEFRQPQKYQVRTTQLRQALQRTEADIAGLQRELSRASAGAKP
jgi:hypothetical protein